jgi:teichuronic acid biosynthesis protein TuaE
MSVRFDQPVSLQRSPGGRLPDLRWPIGLAVAGALPFLLPLTSPVGFAVFAGVVGVTGLFARHWLIAMLPLLAVLGLHFLPLQAMGVNVFGFRLLIMLLAAFSTPLTTSGGWWFNRVARAGILVLLFWLSWGLLSLFWTANVRGGLNDVVIIVFGLGLLLSLLSLDAHRRRHLDKLRFGWLLALVAAGASAAIEIVTGRELTSDPAFQVAQAGASLDADTMIGAVQALFDNSNMFGGFLLLTMPFVLWSIERAKGPTKLFHLGLLLMVGALVLFSASRLALVGLVIQLAFYALVLQRRWYMPLLVAVAGLAAVSYGSLVVESDLKVAQKLEDAESGDRSIASRVALTLNGLWMTYRTAGRGIGAAAFEEEITGDVPFEVVIDPTKSWNAHNFWVEVMSEYGVLTFAALVALLVWIGRLGWQARHSRGDPERQRVGGALLVGLMGYLFFGVTGGSIISQPASWMFLATLVVMAASLADRRPAAARAAPPIATGKARLPAAQEGDQEPRATVSTRAIARPGDPSPPPRNGW